MFWRARKKKAFDYGVDGWPEFIAQREQLKAANQVVADQEAAMAAMGQRMKEALDATEEAKQQLFAKTAENEGLYQAYRNVGDTAGYRLRKVADESWADYKDRVHKLLESHRDSDIVKAILDILSFTRRETYREFQEAKEPSDVLRLHAEARAIDRCMSRLVLSMTSRDSRALHEETLQGLKDWSLLDLDEKRLASSRKPH